MNMNRIVVALFAFLSVAAVGRAQWVELSDRKETSSSFVYFAPFEVETAGSVAAT
jgi:hypothetical protein